MKRASLKSTATIASSPAREDVTDRLLAGSPSRKIRTPRSVKSRRTTQPNRESVQAPPSAIVEPTEAGSTNQAALDLTRRALAALRAARETAPARYDLGARYRLDALAHHLEQVASYVLGQTGSSSNA